MRNIKEEKIDLEKIVKTIWNGRLTILKITSVFFVVGVFIAIISKVEYRAYCQLMPEAQETVRSNLGGLGSLAGIVGINLDMGKNNALLPEHYPLIAKSLPFLKQLINTPVRFQKLDTIISPYNYFLEIDRPSFFDLLYRYSVRLPYKIKSWIIPPSSKTIKNIDEKSSIINLSYDEYRIYQNFRERINAEVDIQTGIIYLSVEMPDAFAVAEVADNSIKILTSYVTDYKISKAKENLIFIQERYEEAKANFEDSQSKLAIFNDRNRNVTTSIAQIEKDRLQNEYNLHFELFKNLATQLEQAKITVKEQTPVFTVLEPVQVPIKKSKPQRILTVSILLFLGVVVSIFSLFIKQLSK